MTTQRQVLVEKAAAVERHLARVAVRLPSAPSDFNHSTDATDAVILHLFQAVQLVIDLALATAARLKLGTPASYAEAFRLLAGAGHIEAALAERLTRAAGFRNLVAHAHEGVDLSRVYEAAQSGPPDLRAFLAAVAKLT